MPDAAAKTSRYSAVFIGLVSDAVAVGLNPPFTTGKGKKMITVLIGFGANDIEQPCLFFENMEQGIAYVREHIPGVASEAGKWNGREGRFFHFDHIPSGFGMLHALTKVNPLYKEAPPHAYFWTRYSLAGDGVYKFFLGEFDYATPIAKYALD